MLKMAPLLNDCTLYMYIEEQRRLTQRSRVFIIHNGYKRTIVWTNRSSDRSLA